MFRIFTVGPIRQSKLSFFLVLKTCYEKCIFLCSTKAISKRSLDSLGGHEFIKKSLDSLGGHEFIKKSLDSLGGHEFIKKSLDSLGGHEFIKKSLDSLGK